MNLKEKHIAYFIGIGGIGMSAIARWFNLIGMTVSGYDKTPSLITNRLKNLGIEIHFTDSISNIPDQVKANKEKVLVVYTPAIPKQHHELNYLLNQGYDVIKRSEALGQITKDYHTIAVAGTHGKTTTSTMIAHILKDANMNMVAFLGGISSNYESNLITCDGEDSGKKIAVVEADEFDRSFLQLFPDLAVITSADADHLDIYGDKKALEKAFGDFAKNVKPNGTLIINQRISSVIEEFNNKIMKRYSLENGDLKSTNLKIKDGAFYFDYQNGTTSIQNLKLHQPGFHNVENMIAAIGVAIKLGIGSEKIREAVDSYQGVKRRFEYIIKSEDLIFIDDYAHHPVEIDSSIKSIRQIYPDKTLTIVFQPHLFSRTQDFAVEFAESLSEADQLILLDIYPAREEPIPGVSSEIIFDKVKTKKISCTKEELIKVLSGLEIEVLATLGAGDIDQLVDPIKNYLTSEK